ncbi:MAG: hypothetical protein HYX33_02920 [Actinobacteria bacterium]|nr:hypothetical protein [Actinomycetota bacterium]
MSTDDPFDDFETVDDRPSRSSRPTRRPSRPRSGGRPSSRPPRQGPRRPAGGGGGLLAQPGARLAVGLGAAVLLIVILTFVVKGCRRDSLVSSYKQYVTGAASINRQSAAQGKEFIKILTNADSANPATLRSKLTTLAGQADQLVVQAKKLSTPDRLRDAGSSLVSALAYRATNVQSTADAIQTIAGSTNLTVASAQIAERMQRFLASDVIYKDSWVGPTMKTLSAEKISGVTVPGNDVFLQQANYAAPVGARDLVSGIQRKGGGSSRPSTATGTGTVRGTSLVSVSALPSGVRLTAGAAAQTLKASDQLKWRIAVNNGGDFTESNVTVRVTFTDTQDSANPQVQETQITNFAPNETRTVDVPGPQVRNFNVLSSLRVEVVPVTGEKSTANNVAQYAIKITF